MKVRARAVASMCAGVVILGGCVADPAPPSTTLASGAPAAGCYDSFVDTIDLMYSGVPDVVGNLTPHDSGDGTCQGLRTRYVYTLVYSPDNGQHAAEFCAANGLQAPQAMDAREATYDWRLNGVSIGPDAYLCMKSAV